MLRMLLISGDTLSSQTSLRRRVLRFTGSRRATRAILQRIEHACALGRVVSCLVRPSIARETGEYGDELGWNVSVSYAGRLPAARGAS